LSIIRPKDRLDTGGTINRVIGELEALSKGTVFETAYGFAAAEESQETATATATVAAQFTEDCSCSHALTKPRP
jgi:hypothetical protein